jgi:hypothetical protein
MRGMEPNPYEAPKGTGYSRMNQPRRSRAGLIAFGILVVVLALVTLDAIFVKYLEWKSLSAPATLNRR